MVAVINQVDLIDVVTRNDMPCSPSLCGASLVKQVIKRSMFGQDMEHCGQCHFVGEESSVTDRFCAVLLILTDAKCHL